MSLRPERSGEEEPEVAFRQRSFTRQRVPHSKLVVRPIRGGNDNVRSSSHTLGDPPDQPGVLRSDGGRAVQAFVLSDPIAKVFHQFRFGRDHGTGLVLQRLESLAKDIEKWPVVVTHERKSPEQLSL